jgi:hypothetical protein
MTVQLLSMNKFLVKSYKEWSGFPGRNLAWNFECLESI